MVLKADAILNVVVVAAVVVVVLGVSLGSACLLGEALEPSAGSVLC